MKQRGASLRQVMVLTVTGLLSPAADLLPGLLAERAGVTAWAVPVILLPVVLLWGAMLGRLFRKEGSSLFSLLRHRGGWGLGGALTSLYIMWGIYLLAEQISRCAARMSVVYGGRGSETVAALLLLLVVWMLWKEGNGIYRAGELFWLGAAVGLFGVLLMGFAQVKWNNILPVWSDWRDQPGGWLPYLNVWGSAVFAAALVGDVPRRRASVKNVLGWLVAGSLGMAALIAVILGQTGVGLAGRLSHPFLIAVQGLSLEGALARLEAPVAALWLLADFCRAALLVAALREAGGKRWGRWLVALGSALAVAIGILFPGVSGAGFFGLLLGGFLPFCLWLSALFDDGTKVKSTYCGE